MSQKKIWIQVRSDADVARSVVEAGRFASELGFDDHARYKITTAVSELARNIIKYAGSGEIIIVPLSEKRRTGIEITVRDKGPGIEDVEKAMADHFSSSGTLGLGLPGVKRLMDEFEIESALEKGTKVVIRKWR